MFLVARVGRAPLFLSPGLVFVGLILVVLVCVSFFSSFWLFSIPPMYW